VRDALKDTDTMGWTAGQQSVANVATQVANFATTADIGYDADSAALTALLPGRSAPGVLRSTL
jgi:hypothetical protein